MGRLNLPAARFIRMASMVLILGLLAFIVIGGGGGQWACFAEESGTNGDQVGENATDPGTKRAFVNNVYNKYTWKLTIMHTNDTHAHLDEIARRATAINQVRAEASNNLLLDAGDVFSGTLYFTQYQGQDDLEFMNMLGYDAMGMGNHEFDKGPGALADFITANYSEGYKTAAQFPVLNTNFDFSKEPALSGLAKTTVGEEGVDALAGQIYPAVILNVNGEKVGVFGVDTEDTREASSPGENIVINAAFVSAKTAVNMLEDKGINKIIAISHLGWGKDLQLAYAVEGIDVVVGGHSHTLPAVYPTVVTDPQYHTPTLVVQANEYGNYLGCLDVSFNKDGLVTASDGQLIDITAKDAVGNYVYAEDQTVNAKLDEYSTPLEVFKSTVVGSTQVALDGERDNARTKETNLGNLIANSMLEKAASVGATMAITNGGGVRASIAQGDITLDQVLTVMPFGNTLTVLELNGQQIIDALENGVSQVAEKAGRFPQVAGLKFTWNPAQPAGSRIVKVDVKADNGYQPIKRDAKYKVATINYMAGGGDGYDVFKEASKSIELGFVDYEIFREYLAKHSPVNPQVEGLISRLPKTTTGNQAVPVDGGLKNPYPDVPAGYWAYSDIAALYQKSIMKGYPDGAFKPENSITRTEFAVLLARAMNWQPKSGSLGFADADSIPAWASGYVAAAVEKGGSSGKRRHQRVRG